MATEDVTFRRSNRDSLLSLFFKDLFLEIINILLGRELQRRTRAISHLPPGGAQGRRGEGAGALGADGRGPARPMASEPTVCQAGALRTRLPRGSSQRRLSCHPPRRDARGPAVPALFPSGRPLRAGAACDQRTQMPFEASLSPIVLRLAWHRRCVRRWAENLPFYVLGCPVRRGLFYPQFTAEKAEPREVK